MTSNEELPPPPPNPPVFEAPYPSGNNPEVRGIRKFLLIVGIVGGFNMYIIPGIFGIRTYRRWKRGEVPTPSGWMVWGATYLGIVILGIVIQAQGGLQM